MVRLALTVAIQGSIRAASTNVSGTSAGPIQSDIVAASEHSYGGLSTLKPVTSHKLLANTYLSVVGKGQLACFHPSEALPRL